MIYIVEILQLNSRVEEVIKERGPALKNVKEQMASWTVMIYLSEADPDKLNLIMRLMIIYLIVWA